MTARARIITLGTLLAAAVLTWVLWPTPTPPRSPTLGAILGDLGFTQLTPPSKLTPPGTFVTVQSRDPMVIGLVCTAQSALGPRVADRLVHSTSADLSTLTDLNKNFGINVTGLLPGKLNVEDIRTVSVKLVNVRVSEIPDEAVFGGLDKRSNSCAAAIGFRRRGDKPLTIVKSALYADAQFSISFKTGLSSSAKVDAVQKLGVQLGLALHSEGDYAMSGKGLIWGIRDDKDLAGVGDLPAAGGARQRLFTAGTTTRVVLGTQSLPPLVALDVAPVRQPTRMSCWAAVTTMLLAWRSGDQKLTIKQALGKLGPAWSRIYKADKGISTSQQRDLVTELGLKTEAPQNFTPRGWETMLKRYGPLLVYVGDGIAWHAMLIVGARGDGTFEGTFLDVNDPATGTRRVLHAATVAEEFEKEARRLIDFLPDRDLRPQVAHWPAAR